MRKCISFCVTDDSLKSIIENILLAKELYPEWEIRIYIDSKNQMCNELEKLTINIIKVFKTSKLTNELFYKMLAIQDNDIDYVIFRSFKNRISKREVKFVNNWIESEKILHLITETDPIYKIGLSGIFLSKFKKLSLNINHSFTHGTHKYEPEAFIYNNLLMKLPKSEILIHSNEPLYEGEVLCNSIFDENNQIVKDIKTKRQKVIVFEENLNGSFTEQLKVMQHFAILYSNWTIKFHFHNKLYKNLYESILNNMNIETLEFSEFYKEFGFVYEKFFYLNDVDVDYLLLNPETLMENNIDINKLVENMKENEIIYTEDNINPFLLINVLKFRNKYPDKIEPLTLNSFVEQFKPIIIKDFGGFVDLRVETLENKKISAVLFSRNDDYIIDYKQRGKICFEHLLNAVDEIVYVDWGSENGVSFLDKLMDELKDEIDIKRWKTIKHIIVPIEEVRKIRPVDAEECTQVLARNIGLRYATGDFIISTNIDIISPPREMLNKIKIYPNSFYVIRRINLMNDYKICEYNGINKKISYNYLMGPKLINDRHYISFIDPIMDHYIHSLVSVPNEWKNILCLYERIDNPGDFQIGSKYAWNSIRGFEEEMIHSYNSDYNIHVKIMKEGFNLVILTAPGVFHIDHNCKRSYDEKLILNSLHKFVYTFEKTTNKDTWGFWDPINNTSNIKIL